VKRPRTLDDARSLVESLLAAGLASVDPREKVAACLRRGSALPGGSRPVVIAIGKAATSMANGACDVLGDRIRSGIILTKDDHAAGAPSEFAVYEAAHPVPDQRGLDATQSILDTVDALGRGDEVLILISGGGSALLELPRPPVTLADLQVTTSLLLRAGAPIHHLNAVRSELSQVKGGGLRHRIGEASCVTLILSDVLGNDLRAIASGPTTSRRPNPSGARKLLDQYHVTDRIPESVLEALHCSDCGEEGTGDDDVGDVLQILADNDVLIDAIDAEAVRRGYRAQVLWRQQEGEARNLARSFVGLLVRTCEDIDVVIGGGEATVTVQGDGTGGRNTEFALAAGLDLLDATDGDRWVIASIASDGQDGAVDAAGAITNAESVRRGDDMGLDPRAALDENDSGGYFERTGELVRTGQTGTNVNDVYLGVRLDSGPTQR